MFFLRLCRTNFVAFLTLFVFGRLLVAEFFFEPSLLQFASFFNILGATLFLLVGGDALAVDALAGLVAVVLPVDPSDDDGEGKQNHPRTR